LFTIAYRLIVSSYRKKSPIRLSQHAAENFEAKTSKDKSENNWLWQSVQDMTSENRMVLWMRYKQDMTIPEIAKITGKSEICIRVRLHRARIRLEKLINKHPDKPKHWHLPNVVCMKGTD
jgi:RNA polymerase sigma factor (sigma-70 family)